MSGAVMTISAAPKADYVIDIDNFHACSVNAHNVHGSHAQSGRATYREVRVGHRHNR